MVANEKLRLRCIHGDQKAGGHDGTARTGTVTGQGRETGGAGAGNALGTGFAGPWPFETRQRLLGAGEAAGVDSKPVTAL